MTLIFGLLLAALTAPVAAQKGGKPTSKPATGLFRCPGTDCPTADPTALPPILTDAIQGDQFASPFLAADGASIDTVGEFSLRLLPNERSLFLDFSNGSPLCGAACRRSFANIAIDYGNVAFFHTNVIDPATGGEAGNGLLSIPVGATWRSRLKLAFDTVGPNGERIQWAVRFNPRDYYPSDHISIFRSSLTTWEIFATDAERAMLVSVCCRQRGYTNEGLYAMPFRLHVSTP
ncbi:MAG: hypothetical protein LC753_01325 [Acidobacteria bacterium]|nr:hypothetical protein [Acidobacteriota bacterium]MCA1648951.1 hypothetical protein [Acidobacteriota bacterium]